MNKSIVLGGGCFWGLQDLIRKQPGIVSTIVGYSGQPSAEVVKIEYDSQKSSFKKLLDFFFQIHNPTTLNQQGNDMGASYRSVIFYNDEQEKNEAKDMIDIVNNSKRWPNPVVTSLEPFQEFKIAEDFHQDYLIKNPNGYTCHRIYFNSYL